MKKLQHEPIHLPLEHNAHQWGQIQRQKEQCINPQGPHSRMNAGLVRLNLLELIRRTE